MFGKKGIKSPRFKDYVLQLSSSGEILERYESANLAGKAINGQASGIQKCLSCWRGINYNNRHHFSYRGYQWIYEQDYQLLKTIHDFSKISTADNFITTKMINKGALDSNI